MGKVFVGPFVLPTIHKHLLLQKIKIISSKMTQKFLTLYPLLPPDPHWKGTVANECSYLQKGIISTWEFPG